MCDKPLLASFITAQNQAEKKESAAFRPAALPALFCNSAFLVPPGQWPVATLPASFCDGAFVS